MRILFAEFKSQQRLVKAQVTTSHSCPSTNILSAPSCPISTSASFGNTKLTRIKSCCFNSPDLIFSLMELLCGLEIKG